MIKKSLGFLFILTPFILALCSCSPGSKVINSNPVTSATNTQTSGKNAINIAARKKAEAFKSTNGHEASAAIDGDTSTYWESKGIMLWTLDLEEETVFNTVKIKYSGNIKAWSVQYLNTDLNKFIDVPGMVKNWQKNVSGPTEITFKVLPIKTRKLQFNVYLGDGPVKIYDFAVYNIKDQDPVDSRNSYITLRHNRLLDEIALGDKGVFDVFPKSEYKVNNNGKWTTDIITDHKEIFFDNSKWCAGLDETTVFNAQISHKQGSGDKDWTMRVGNGGQIYSLVTPIGEIIPLQNSGAEWMDEVWQIVVTSMSKMVDRTIPAMTHYIHQAGMYKHFDNDEKAGRDYMDDTFYSPRLAQKWDTSTGNFSTLNLGVTPSLNMSRSDTLMYTNIKDIGDGMIEITYGVANYSGNTLNWNNFPWGGVSKKLLPDIIISRPDNSLYIWDKDWQSTIQSVDMKDTAGWMGYTQDINNQDSFTVAFVLGKDNYNDGTIDKKRSGTLGALAFDSGNDGRDYNVFSTIDTFKIYQDDLFYVRMYVIMGPLGEVTQKAKAMSEYTRRGYITVGTNNAELIPIYKTKDSESNKDILLTDGSGTPAFYVYDRHVTLSRPLYFLYDNINNKYVVSTDPYLLTTKIPLSEFADTTLNQFKRFKDILVTAPGDGKTDYIGILGYVLLEDAANNDGSVKLCDVLDSDLFPGTGLEDASVMVKKTV